MPEIVPMVIMSSEVYDSMLYRQSIEDKNTP